jgi:predicted RNase H-like HicB family nuclease
MNIMKERSRFLGSLFNKTHNSNIEVKVDLIEYEESGIYYVYCPAFDLVGYGKTPHEARESWEAVLEQYFSYTLNKKTLIKDLESRGWVVRKKKQFTAPSLSWMLQNNDQLTDIYDNHNFKKVTKPISVPLAYA